jgi:hypothetical protein
MRTEARRKWAQEKAERLFHEWAALPDYEPLDEDMAIALVCRIRDALIDVSTEKLPDTNALGVGGTSVGWNHSGACLDGCNCDLARAAKRASEGDSHA